ncbi:MAG: hypothetical protein JNM47_06390 [Hyphomonadaceae bacterium]|nr:hypothetical protein [Hyphomonadaceae bacterium]
MKRAIAIVLLAAWMAIIAIWHYELASARLITIAIGIVGLASILLLDIPSLLKDRRKN